MASPEFERGAGRSDRHFSSKPFVSNSSDVAQHAFDHGGSSAVAVFDQTAQVGRVVGHHGGLSSHDRGGDESNFRTTTDVARNMLSPNGFSFQNPSSNAHREEHKNTHHTDTDISTEQKQGQVHVLVSRNKPLQESNIIHQQQRQQPLTSPIDPNTGGITSQPTLLPLISGADFHDSNTAEITSGSNIQQPRLGGASASAITQTSRTAFDSAATANIHNNDLHEALNRQNMGYNRNTGEASWRDHTPEQKMEQAPQHFLLNGTGANHTERKDHDDDSTTIRSTDSASLGSPSHGPMFGAPAAMEHHTLPAGVQSAVTTPSTVSTAPSSTDEVSLGALDPSVLERLALRGENLDANAFHRRGTSWENPPYQSQLYVPDETDHGTFSRSNIPSLPPSAPSAPNAWGNNQQQRVASFRNEYGTTPEAPDQRWQQQHAQQPPRYEHQGPYGPARNPPNTNVPYSTYHGQRTQLPPSATPPRTGRAPRGPPSSNPHRPSPAAASANSGTPISSGNPRSPSEVLKTLLRKKACLYEPDTSRAVALATWLVGRVLALEHGYFSRQQLQAGVHACVAGKIDSGVITRTKVNRCMQIILNSCFHYIIPRPDGTEENGDAFRFVFANEVADDIRLLRELPAPWNDLSVDRDVVLEASAADLEGKSFEGKSLKTSPGSAPVTPQSSPKLGSIPAENTSPKPRDDLDHDSKRAVLLCFNENVRCAEDVFRCHNEFIRDTAHASGLQLSSSEWRAFFGKEAAGAPHLWGNIGIPVPHSETSNQVDALGMMTSTELAKFRTSWCSKRYDHDHELCGFAHVEVNGGWLRRNSHRHQYKMEMCPDIVQFSSRGQGNRRYVVNSCPHGENCEFAHSPEEIVYHPGRYKSGLCSSLARPGGCPRGDVCSDFHPAENYKFSSKKGDGRLNSRQARQGANSGKGAPTPSVAPILYCSPAPVSRFEEQFHLPGLKNLYRRHCSVMKAHLRNPGSCVCCYSNFGDDNGTGTDPAHLSKTFKRGLPQPRGV
eukprot:CAMPEP_0172455424 /NCGR_PEP_ID=MMETSP1065-20121228/12058_1 /TAXON_ID=265537 /ORGANISM="Amphiprora paludosa, Strain CCMP125" /LENGTH=1007 /DNA_ID=CAMNT_0013207885 /DNA_START=515 /DNA_END=3538 /DNA_ORIENTATION=+